MWSLDNLKRQSHEVNLAASYLDATVVCHILLGGVIIALAYYPIHRLYDLYNPIYQHHLAPSQRVVVVQHTIEAILLSLFFPPFTYLMLAFNFQTLSQDDKGRVFRTLCVLMGIVILMYSLEVASRAVLSLRKLVLLHHVCTIAVGLFAGYRFSEASMSAALFLVYYIGFEAMLFVGLILYRLCPSHRCTKPVLLVGMTVFAVSRPLQVLSVFGNFFANREILELWEALVMGAMTIFFTILQVLSLGIHVQLYRKCPSNKTSGQAESESPPGPKEVTVRADDNDEWIC